MNENFNKTFQKVIMDVGRNLNILKSICETVGSLKIRYLDIIFKIGRIS